MDSKSDFAQKLLHDLRLRKERMVAAGDHPTRQSTKTSRAMHGNSATSSKGAQHINALEYTDSRTGNTSTRFSRAISVNESSNQIVLYESGQSSRQVRDLTMAIAFAFENSRNLCKTGSSSNNPLVNFFNRFSRRSTGSQKMDMANLTVHGLPIDQFPNASNIHISEISKGVQKLNQILRACSNGFNFDQHSIEVGKELLKGAVDLEESLRMLVNLQESSRYMNGDQSKTRIKLLEEDEDDQEDSGKTTGQWKLDRPRFSFDKPSRNSYTKKDAAREHQLVLSYTDGTPDTNSKMVLHKRSTSHVQGISLSTQEKLNENSSSSTYVHEKGRISNVIAKLMGLEELPQKEGSKGMADVSKGEEGKPDKVSKRNIKLHQHLNTDRKPSLANNDQPVREPKLQVKSDKSWDVPDGISKIASSERNKLQKIFRIPEDVAEVVPDQKTASIVMNKKQRHARVSNHASAHHSFEDGGRKQNHLKDKESKVIERESSKPVLNTEMQIKAQKSKRNRVEHNLDVNSIEKRSSDNGPGNQEKPKDQRVILQDYVPKRNEGSEDKWEAEQRGQQFQKQNLIAKKQERHQMEMEAASKSKKNTAAYLKKLSHDKSAPIKGKPVKPSEKVPMINPLNKRHKDVASTIDKSQETASNQETFNKGESLDSSSRESHFDINQESSAHVHSEEKPIEQTATKMKVIPGKVQKSEIPQKIEMLMTRRNANMNHLPRSRTRPANILKDLKQHMHSENRSSKRMKAQSSGKVKEEKELDCDTPDTNAEPLNQRKLQIEVDQKIILPSYVSDNCYMQNTPLRIDNNDSTNLNSGKNFDDLQSAGQSYALRAGQELKEREQLGDDHEVDKESHTLFQQEHTQFPAWARQELTEPEKDLKEILIKSQLFLSTAEALFKLKIPVSFLYIGDHDDEVAKKKLVLDSAYEVMKRKARRNEISFHPYPNNAISYTKVRSLDDMVRLLSRDLEMLKFYGGNGSIECDVAASLHTMLNSDIYDKNPDVNCMWDLEWNKILFIIPEKDEVIRDIEKQMLNGLLDEITNDLLLRTV